MAANDAIVNVSGNNRPSPVESAVSALTARASSAVTGALTDLGSNFNLNIRVPQPNFQGEADLARSAIQQYVENSSKALVAGAKSRLRNVADQYKVDPNLSLVDISMISDHPDSPPRSSDAANMSLDLFDNPLPPSPDQIQSYRPTPEPAPYPPSPAGPRKRPAWRPRPRSLKNVPRNLASKKNRVYHPGTSMSGRARHYAAKYGRARTYTPRSTRRYTKKTYRRKAAPRKTTTRRRYTRKVDTLKKVRLTVADQVINRPFARNRNPRLPDGSAIESHGRQFRMVQDINLSPNSVYVMHIYPGLHSGVLVYKEAEFNSPDAQWIVPRGLGSAVTNNNIFGQAFLHEGGVNDPIAGWENLTSLPAYSASGETGRKDLDFWSSKNIERWRMLSNGVHVNLLNNLDEADGWFEACRTPMENNCSALYWTDSQLGASTTGNPGISFEPGKVGQKCLSYVAAINPQSMNMAQQPGYLTGSLRDINKVMFRSKKIGQTHSWISGTEHSYIDNQIMQVTEPETSIVHTGLQCHPSQSNSPQAVMDKLTDRNFDTVFIRIHTGSVGSGANKAKLLIDYVTNHEYVYDTGSSYASFQTKNIGV